MNKKTIFFILFAVFSIFSIPEKAGYANVPLDISSDRKMISVVKAAEKIPERMLVWVTAYSSTPEETDSTPFVTASMTEVRDGVLAANFLPFGVKVKIPKLFGDKIFTVEDRMHQRKTNFVDIWMETKEKAKEFGIARAEIVLVD